MDVKTNINANKPIKLRGNLTMRTRIKINLLCLMLGIALIGCSHAVNVHVLNEDEIELLSEGETFTAPYDGTFYSQRAEQRIMNARVIKANLKGN